MSDYNDILHLCRPASPTRVRMSLLDRAAQFAPFAALTGYEAVIEETRRLTEPPIEPDEGLICRIDRQLRLLAQRLPARPAATVVYFSPDPRKDGGRYVRKSGAVKEICTVSGLLRFADRTCVPLSSIVDILLPED